MTELDLAALREQYTSEPVPPCRVCGAALSPVSVGGGRAPQFACAAAQDQLQGTIPEAVIREAVWTHYGDSQWTMYRSGDSRVVQLIDELERTQGLRSSIPYQPGDPAEPRELLGRLVHQVWNDTQQPRMGSGTYLPSVWEQCSETTRETCMRIAAVLVEHCEGMTEAQAEVMARLDLPASAIRAEAQAVLELEAELADLTERVHHCELVRDSLRTIVRVLYERVLHGGPSNLLEVAGEYLEARDVAQLRITLGPQT